jgi:ABC-type transporter Mla maintaining outer membrane lipid asymmetry ATPase subunit MlaF
MASAATIAPYIEFKDVSKAFGDRVILQNVSFDVMPGEMASASPSRFTTSWAS